MNPSGCGAHIFRHVGEKSDDVVLGHQFNFIDAVAIEVCLFGDLPVVLIGDNAHFVERT